MMFGFDDLSVAEKKRDTPDTGDADKCENDSAYRGGLTAEYPGNDIEGKNADASPVNGTYDYKQQCNSV